MSARDKAVELAKHYLVHVHQMGGPTGSLDSLLEVEELVDLIIDAAVDRLQQRMRQEGQRLAAELAVNAQRMIEEAERQAGGLSEYLPKHLQPEPPKEGD